MKAIILAGGRGSRLMPLTENIPKPLVSILDKPILWYIFKLLNKYNITQVGVTLGYKGEEIKRQQERFYSKGIDVTFFEEKSPLGTAGCILNAKEFLDEDFVILSGDALTDINLDEFIDFHYEKGGLASLAVKQVEDPSSFGVIVKDGNGLITNFQEKPQNPLSNLASTGIYVMSKDILKEIPEGFCDFAKDVFPKLLGKLYAMQTNCYWTDVGTLASYRQAVRQMAKRGSSTLWT